VEDVTFDNATLSHYQGLSLELPSRGKHPSAPAKDNIASPSSPQPSCWSLRAVVSEMVRRRKRSPEEALPAQLGRSQAIPLEILVAPKERPFVVEFGYNG
jgi:hypothetical protein